MINCQVESTEDGEDAGDKAIHQSINQSIHKSINQSINQPINQSIKNKSLIDWLSGWIHRGRRGCWGQGRVPTRDVLVYMIWLWTQAKHLRSWCEHWCSTETIFWRNAPMYTFYKLIFYQSTSEVVIRHLEGFLFKASAPVVMRTLYSILVFWRNNLICTL